MHTHTMYFPYLLNRYYNAVSGPILLEVSLNPDSAVANVTHDLFSKISKAVMHLIVLSQL